MPITLITGAPGNGKTLLLLWEVERRRQAEKREVYYSGVKDLLIPWHLFGGEPKPGDDPHMTDPSNWYELPVGSLIVIDEAQRLFRTRSLGAQVPEYVSRLETHRHKGYDIYLVTQSPMLIDSNVRNLVETHKHLMRKFGSRWATIHEWKGVKNNCIVSRKDSAESQFKYPKEVYTWYKSAEVHTVKFRLPGKVMVLIAAPFVLAGAAGYAWYTLQGFARKDAPQAGAAVVAVPAQQQPVKGPTVARPGASAGEYTAQFRPRWDGLYYTAPRYDDLTKPVRVPVPVGCVLVGDREGWCVTQQGTRFVPPVAVIRSFIVSGLFIDFERGSGVGDAAAKPSASSGPAPVSTSLAP